MTTSLRGRRKAPVALFVYKRTDHARRAVDALRANPEAADTEVLVYSDGPKTRADRAAVAEVRRYVSGLSGFKTLKLIFRDRNMGLADAFIAGVTETLEEYDRVIVLEDDNLTSPHFLRFMNEALDEYENDDRVVSISGYVYPSRKQLPETFFIKGADSWGWATWRKGWACFNPDGKALLDELHQRRAEHEFDFNDSFCYSCMLEGQVAGLNNSWSVRWYASAFLRDKLTLYPGRSLVRNIGNDSSGTHCATSDAFDVPLSSTPVRVGSIPVEESTDARRAVEEFFKDAVRTPHRAKMLLRKVLGPGRTVFLRRLAHSFTSVRSKARVQ